MQSALESLVQKDYIYWVKVKGSLRRLTVIDFKLNHYLNFETTITQILDEFVNSNPLLYISYVDSMLV